MTTTGESIMRSIAILVAAFVSFVACTKDGSTSAPRTPPLSIVASASQNDDIQWGPAPPIFPKGAEFAVLQGDPSSTNEFTVRLRFPNGYKIPPHTHPTIENVTVLKGTFLAGMGDKLDESQ